ncbi:MAG: peptide chain release factor N(5)-glutamine methyltransferase [Myxococcota bacterium]
MSGEVWTVLALLRWTTEHFASRGIETARLDAECLLAHALGSDRLRLYLDFEKPVLPDERAVYRELVRRRATDRVPVAQLVGEKEFWSLALRVTPDVLVPRPETETLVAAVLEALPDPAAPARVLELGTGSGAIALALAKERPAAVITATDVSAEALKLAQENAETHGVAERIRFLEGDGVEPVRGKTFDVLVSNPPYVAEKDRERLPPELAHEPPGALFAGPDGLDVLRRFVADAPALLAPGGRLALEHGEDQSDAVADLCRRAGFGQVVTRRDLGGRLRVVTARAPAEGAGPSRPSSSAVGGD